MNPPYLDAVSHGTTGTKTFTCGFPPKKLTVYCGPKFSETNKDITRSSHGVSDGTYQFCDSQYSDGTATGSGPLRHLDRIVHVRDRVSGTVSVRTSAIVDQTVAPWTATTCSYIVTVADPNFQYWVEIEG